MNYHTIIKHYEECLKNYGDTPQGMDWPNEPDLLLRYDMLLDMVKFPGTVLDFGCGTARILTHIRNKELPLDYIGLDASQDFIAVAKSKFNDTQFLCQDVLQHPLENEYDFIIMNGVLTEKLSLTHDEMWDYSQALLRHLFSKCRKILACGFVSTHAEFKYPHLFHLNPGDFINFANELTQFYTIRHDYGLGEYTVYLHKNSITTINTT